MGSSEEIDMTSCIKCLLDKVGPMTPVDSISNMENGGRGGESGAIVIEYNWTCSYLMNILYIFERIDGDCQQLRLPWVLD